MDWDRPFQLDRRVPHPYLSGMAQRTSKSSSKRASRKAAGDSAENNVTAIVKRLRDEGFRITPQREDILRLLAEDPRRRSVQEIFNEIRAIHGSISLDTVYRTLATFANLGVVAQIKAHGTDVVYEFQPPGHHHHHAVCLSCGKSICLTECPLPKSYFRNLENENFRVLSHSFEVYGYCNSCG